LRGANGDPRVLKFDKNGKFLKSGTGEGKERLIVSLRPPTQGLEPDSLVAMWDIVLENG
jgi:hypothetical protein